MSLQKDLFPTNTILVLLYNAYGKVNKLPKNMTNAIHLLTVDCHVLVSTIDLAYYK